MATSTPTNLFTPTPSVISYTIELGDTISLLSEIYDVPMVDIMVASRITPCGPDDKPVGNVDGSVLGPEYFHPVLLRQILPFVPCALRKLPHENQVLQVTFNAQQVVFFPLPQYP